MFQNRDFDIFTEPPKNRFGGSILGVEISNRPNKVRVSKNHENLVFEITRFIGVWSAKESFLIVRKMFRGRFVIGKSIFLNPDFGPKRNFEWKWKSTLQRWAFSGKLGFWQNFGGPQGDPHKKKSARPKNFFLPKIENLEPKGHFGCRSVPPPSTTLTYKGFSEFELPPPVFCNRKFQQNRNFSTYILLFLQKCGETRQNTSNWAVFLHISSFHDWCWAF